MAKLAVRGKNIDITPAIKDYVSKKFSKLDKYGQHIVEIVVELHVERNPRIADNKIVDVNIYANGAVLRATDGSPDMYASIDMVIDKLDRQMKKYEEKKIRNRTGKLKISEAIASENNSAVDLKEESEDEQYSTY
jgi:putative sigma-54 modulation protein